QLAATMRLQAETSPSVASAATVVIPPLPFHRINDDVCPGSTALSRRTANAGFASDPLQKPCNGHGCALSFAYATSSTSIVCFINRTSERLRPNLPAV